MTMKNCSNKPKMIVSLDFELFWGMQDGHTLESYKENVLGGRRAIPRLLDMFSQYGIHATWATVGYLFADDQDDVKQFFPPENALPNYSNRRLSTYRLFEYEDELAIDRDCFFAPSLIREISEAKGQEIGCHTFSHYYCREPGQSKEQFSADLDAAKRIANKKGYQLMTIVLPRNQTTSEYYQIIASKGFVAIREEENDWIHKKVKNGTLLRMLRLMDVYLPLTGQGGYLPQKKGALLCLPGSRMYKPRFSKLLFLERTKLRRIKRQMLHAARNGLCFHLWWHPHNIGVYTDYHLKQLEEVFAYYQFLHERYGMESLNMLEAANNLCE